MTRGKFITLEGGEGVGKSTNMAFIKNYLFQHKISVVVTREPGGTVLAEKLRQLLLDKNSEVISDQAELLMVFAARAQHIKHVIEPALAKGEWVLCDRFTDSTYAYQGGGRNMRISAIEWLENMVQGALRPDLTLLLDAPVEIGIERARSRAEFDRFESEKICFFEQVRRAYLLQAELHPDRIKLIKANQPLIDVQRALIEIIGTFLR
ncbi:MAG: dTMP kinase [Methylococcales bacterium]|nr:dTMP kinase [uncultured bacterium]ARX77611.1 dTMP kinase [uncultured bacterium]MCX7107076.1 dTMP kinase [Methylococcales bacterium]